jgi:hypothetical protein
LRFSDHLATPTRETNARRRPAWATLIISNPHSLLLPSASGAWYAGGALRSPFDLFGNHVRGSIGKIEQRVYGQANGTD